MAILGILNDDVYSFDETGFLIEQISVTKAVTCSERWRHIKLTQPNCQEWVSAVKCVNSLG